MTWVIQTRMKASSEFWRTILHRYASFDEAHKFGQTIDASRDVRYKNTETGKIVPRFPDQVV